MKRLILSASAVTLTLASVTAAAWWANPYYGAPHGVPAPSPEQLHQLAEQQRTAAMDRMEAQREAMESRRQNLPQRPDFAQRPEIPPMPSFGERPQFPELPPMPSFGERPEIPALPEVPSFGQIPERPEMPAFPEPAYPDFALPERPSAPGYDELPAIPDTLLSTEELKAEREARRAAMQQQAAERRAAMQAIAEQRRALSEQRRRDWLCSRQPMSPRALARFAHECSASDTKTKANAAPKSESADKTADSTPAASKAG
jgi:hypothetical protein